MADVVGSCSVGVILPAVTAYLVLVNTVLILLAHARMPRGDHRSGQRDEP